MDREVVVTDTLGFGQYRRLEGYLENNECHSF